MRKIDEAYDFIREYIHKNNSSPTIREICDGINVKSTSTVTYYLDRLEETHKIARNTFKTRAIQLIENKPINIDTGNILSMPYIDELHTEFPLISKQNITGNYVFNADLFKGYDMFVLPVKDDSMAKCAGIKQGDLIIVSHQKVSNNGEIAVVLLNKDYIIRKISREFNLMRLTADDGFDYDEVYASQVVLLGKVVGLIRPQV